MWCWALETVDWKKMQYARDSATTPCSSRKDSYRSYISWIACQNCVSNQVYLTDGLPLSTYKLVEGSKIHLFTKKIDDAGPKRSVLDVALFNALKSHLTKEEIEKVLIEFNKELQTAFTNYSLDDIERLAVNLLR